MPSSVANATTLPASESQSTPHADVVPGEAKVRDVSEESGGKMSESELEEFCARYGGYMRAKRAATIIQQTYRQYSMSCSFAKLRLEAGESRRSRRFARRRGADCSHHQDSIDIDRSLNLSQLCDAKLEDSCPEMQPTENSDDQALKDGSNGVEVDGHVPDMTALKSSSDEFQVQDDLEDCDDRSGSSRSLSPTLPPPLPAPSDLPSVYFESSLEDEVICGQNKVCPGHGVHDCMYSVCPASYSIDPRECSRSYFQHRLHHCHHDRLGFSVCQNPSNHRTDKRTASLITTRYTDAAFRPSYIFPSPSSSFARFGLSAEHAEPSPIWKRKSGSVESYDTGVGTALEEWDVDMGRSGHADRPWSELYPGSTTSSEDTGSIGSGDAVSHHHHHHTTVDNIDHSVNSSSSSKRSSVLSCSSDQQRKRSYRIGLNLFNR